MRAVRGKNTGPEMLVRRLVFSLGYRYRLHRRDLPGSPDLVFPTRRRVVFIHGCFWHGHPGCRRATRPQTNREFWDRKIDSNIKRDAAQRAALLRLGWKVLTIWQCETKDTERLQAQITAFLDQE